MKHKNEYRSRLEHLRSICREEGIAIDGDSERDFWTFVRLHPFQESGALAVTHEGHVRLVWRGPHDSQLGIRFLGKRRVRYVIFDYAPPDVLQVSGDTGFGGLMARVRDSGIRPFIEVIQKGFER